MFNVALEHGIDSLRVTSCWRPMLGSIVHRAGLGLDVDYVGSTWMNREELRKGKARESVNVSDEEIRLFNQLEAAIAANRRAETDLKEARKAAANSQSNAEEKQQAQKNLKAAEEKHFQATRDKDEATEAWNEERDANEPPRVRLFRTALMRCPCVRQLYDPWYIDHNTKDGLAPEANPRWPLQIPPPVATPNSPRQDAWIMRVRASWPGARRPP